METALQHDDQDFGLDDTARRLDDELENDSHMPAGAASPTIVIIYYYFRKQKESRKEKV